MCQSETMQYHNFLAKKARFSNRDMDVPSLMLVRSVLLTRNRARQTCKSLRGLLQCLFVQRLMGFGLSIILTLAPVVRRIQFRRLPHFSSLLGASKGVVYSFG